MVDYAGLGSLAGGLGTLASGLGLFGGSDGVDKSESVELAKAMRDLQLDNIGPTIQRKVAHTMKAARDYGVHPMYLLGNAPSGGQIQSFAVGHGDKGKTNGRQIGAGLEKMGEALGSQPEVSKTLQDLGLRQAEAETRNSEYRADLTAIELAKATQMANANQESAVTYAAKKPVKQEAIPLYIKVKDRSGKEHWWPNPELNMEMPETFGLGMGLKGWGSDPTKSGINTGPRPSSGRPRHYNYGR